MYHLIPDQAFDELDVYEYRLFGQYVRLLNQSDDQIVLRVRELASLCGISPQILIRARNSLAEKQYIAIQQDFGVRNQRYRTSINWAHFDFGNESSNRKRHMGTMEGDFRSTS